MARPCLNFVVHLNNRAEGAGPICGDAEACIRRFSAREAVGVQTLVLVLAAKNQAELMRRGGPT